MWIETKFYDISKIESGEKKNYSELFSNAVKNKNFEWIDNLYFLSILWKFLWELYKMDSLENITVCERKLDKCIKRLSASKWKKTYRSALQVVISTLFSFQNTYNVIFTNLAESDVKWKCIEWYSLPEFVWMSTNSWRISDLSLVYNHNQEHDFDMLLHKIIDAKKWEAFKLKILYNEHESSNELFKLKMSFFHGNVIERIPTSSEKSSKYEQVNPWIRDWAMRLKNWTIVRPFISDPTYSDIYEELAISEWVDVIQSKLDFQWWNIRQNESTAFIWYDTIFKNYRLRRLWNRDLTAEETLRIASSDWTIWIYINEIINDFRSLFWKEIIVLWLTKDVSWDYIIPKIPQPIYHIDLFFTPINEHEISIGDMVNMDPYLEEFSWEKTAKWDFKNAKSRINDVIQQFNSDYKITKIKSVQKCRKTTSVSTKCDSSYSYNNILLEEYIIWWKTIKRAWIPDYFPWEFWEHEFRVSNDDEIMKKAFIEIKAFYSKKWYEVIEIPISTKTITKWWSLNCSVFEKREITR